MNNETLDITEFDVDLKKLFENIDEIKSDIDLYGMMVDEKVLIAR